MSNNYLSNIDIEQIRRAIQVEEKYKYINIMGKEAAFSGFILKQLRLIYKYSGKNPKWLPVIEAFEHYPTDNIFQRKKSIVRFTNLLKKDLNPDMQRASSNDNLDLYSSDVVMLKGVGPKFGYLLNKLGIYSVFDLISYYPKKYIDYSSRCLIRNLKDGENVTIYGKITAVKTFTTRNNLTIIKVVVSDESASLELNYFYSKINRYSIERYKGQFPKNSGIIVSGTVKKDNYTGMYTIDKPQHQIISVSTLSSEII